MEYLGKVIDNQEVNVKKFIDTVVEEFGKDEGKEVFVQDFMERLDSLAKKHGKDEVFHLTAGECMGYDDNDEPFGVIEFLDELDISSVEDKALQEILRYLNLKMEFERDMLPAELIGELYDELVIGEKEANPWEAKISNDKENQWER